MKGKPGIIFLFLAGILASTAYADDIRVTATLDSQQVSLNQEVHLTIRISGAKGNIPAPRLPVLDGFDTFYTGRASRLTFANGVSSSNVDFSYVLVPKKEGEFSLSPIEVQVNSRVFRTEPMQIVVTGGQKPPPVPYRPAPPAYQPATSPRPLPSSSWSGSSSGGSSAQAPSPQAPSSNDSLFIQAWVDKTSVYPNEQVLLTYSVYTRYHVRVEGFEEEPEVSGFWIEEFPQERNVVKERVKINGQEYLKADIRKMALFPTAPAEYTIKPGTIKASIREETRNNSVYDDFFNDDFFSGGSFFARWKNQVLVPPPVKLTVKPLPEEGRPASFQGAVGNFRVNASVDKQAVKQNEPVTLKVSIEGEGSIETLNLPHIPDMEQFKVYESDASTELFNSGRVIGGRKNFEIVFIPRDAGEYAIPQLEFSYFDPLTERYEIKRTQAFPLRVEESEDEFEMPNPIRKDEAFKKGLKKEGEDIRFIQESLGQTFLRNLYEQIFLALIVINGLLTLLLIMNLWRSRVEHRFSKDTALKRRTLARSKAEQGMKNLRKTAAAKKHDERAYYEEVDKILTQYLADKFNLSAYGGTRSELENSLRSTLGADDPLFKEISELYSICDEARFAMQPASEVQLKEHRDKAMKILRDTISKVEKIKK